MSEDIIIEGVPDSPFYTNDKARKKIEAAMEEAAVLMTKRGQRQLKLPDGSLVDELPEDERNEWYESREAEILMKVRDLDPEFIDFIIPEEY